MGKAPWHDDWDYDSGPLPTPEVWETCNPVVAVLYGPGGEVLRQFSERPTLPFGLAGWKS